MTNNIAHIWYTRVEVEQMDLSKALCRHWVPENEHQKCMRYRFEKDQTLCFTARLLIRSMLSHFTEIRPTDWKFRENRYGKPEICSPRSHASWFFNVTHTAGLVACILSSHHPVGVDAEWLQRGGETLKVADRYFSNLEQVSLFKLPNQEQEARFFAYWTLKEAYIKTRGKGLSIPLKSFSMLLDSPTIEVRHHPNRGDSEQEDQPWYFSLHPLGEDHLMAAAAKSPQMLPEFDWQEVALHPSAGFLPVTP